MSPALLALVTTFIQYVPQLVQAGEAGYQALTDNSSAINTMISENRDPTDAEIAAQDASIKAALATLDQERDATD